MAPDLRVKQEAGKALVPFLSKDRHNLFERGRGDPRHIVLRLEATAAGCQWLIDRWADLRAWLDQGVNWRTNELIAALQLRGLRPLRKDAIEWQGVVEPILPTGNPAAIAEARRRLLLQFDHGLPDDPAGQRAALLRLVDEETERLEQRQAGHRRREAADRAELADRLAVDTSPEGELMRRYQLDNDRKLDRAISGLVKLQRAGVGATGDPAPAGRCEPEPGPAGAVGPERGPADGPEGEADAEVPAGRVLSEHRAAGPGLLPVLTEHPTTPRSGTPRTTFEPEPEPTETVEPESGPEGEADAEVRRKAGGDRVEVDDLAAGGLASSFGPDLSSTPEPEVFTPAAAVAAGEPTWAGIAGPARPAGEPESHPVPQDELSPAVVRGGGAEGSSPDEPGPPGHGDEAPRNEPHPASDGDPIAPNELSCPLGAPDLMKMDGCMDSPVGAQFSEELSPSVGGDPIASDEPAGSRRIADSSVPALICALVILLAAGLSAALAGPLAGPGGRPDSPRDGRSGPAAADVDCDRPGPSASSDPGPRPELIGRSLHVPPIGPVIRPSGPALRPPDKAPGAAISAARCGVPAGGQETGVEGPTQLGVVRARARARGANAGTWLHTNQSDRVQNAPAASMLMARGSEPSSAERLAGRGRLPPG